MEVVISGASKGIGRRTSEKLLEKGHEVWGIARSEDLLHEIERRYRGFHPVVADLTSVEGVRKAASSLPESFDVLVNNLGGASYSPLDKISPEEVDRLVKLNLTAPIMLTTSLLGRIKRSVVFVISDIVYARMPGLTIYGSAKVALDYFADSLRAETHLKVCKVYLPFVKTSFWEHPSFRDVEFGPIVLKTSLDRAADAVVRCVERGGGSVHIPAWVSLAKMICGVYRPVFKLKKKNDR